MTDTIRIHQYTDGPTGHVNVEFIHNDISLGIYGANTTGSNGFGLDGGVYLETNQSAQRIAADPASHYFSDISVSSSQFASALNFAQSQAGMTQAGLGDYDLVCRNCVDFAGSVLGAAGLDRYSIGNHLVDGTLTDIYANTVMLLCATPYDQLMESQGQLNLEYMDQYYIDTFNLNVSWDFDMFWTSEYLDLYYHMASMFGPASWDKYLEALSSDYAATGSPIVIDLNGDGVNTLSLEDAGIAFDITGDDIKEKTGWLSRDDAFLVRDLNGNAVIDGVKEMFGGMHRAEGFAEFATLDENHDGYVSQSDSSFSSLSLWQDLNTNGKTDQGELTTLEAAGFTSLSLGYENRDTWQKGNFLGEASVARQENGLAIDMIDVYFQYESSSIQQKTNSLLQTMATFSTPMADASPLVLTTKSNSPDLMAIAS